MNENLKRQIYAALNNVTPKVCALATVSPNHKAHCFVMGYVILQDLSLVLNTHLYTRKWLDISKNPKVALTFGWSFEVPYIQCEGDAELFCSGNDHLKYEHQYFAVHPDATKYKEKGETGTIKIKPSWFRYYDFSIGPTEIHEFNLELP